MCLLSSTYNTFSINADDVHTYHYVSEIFDTRSSDLYLKLIQLFSCVVIMNLFQRGSRHRLVLGFLKSRYYLCFVFDGQSRVSETKSQRLLRLMQRRFFFRLGTWTTPPSRRWRDACDTRIEWDSELPSESGMGASAGGDDAYSTPTLARLLHSLPHLNVTLHLVNNSFEPKSPVYLEVSVPWIFKGVRKVGHYARLCGNGVITHGCAESGALRIDWGNEAKEWNGIHVCHFFK